MANTPISMNKLRQLTRMHLQGCSKKQIAHQTGISRNTLKRYLQVLHHHPISMEELNQCSDKALEEHYQRHQRKPLNENLQILFARFPQIEKELKRKGMTQLMQWEQYKQEHPQGVGRSQFNKYYAEWKASSNPVMRMEHKAGDKMYIDFAGDKLQVIDKQSGEIQEVEFFVSVLGASQLTYAEAVNSQKKEDLIAACENALHYYQGVPMAIVPDNLKAAVYKSNKYESEINETFADFAQHYNLAVLPARSYRPRDKALVENGVRILYSRIYTRVKEQEYDTLDALNAAIKSELEIHNNKPLSGRPYSRREQFEEIERQALNPLPLLRYELKKTWYATVGKNCHVLLGADKHHYSVPYRFIGKKVKLMYSNNTVYVYYHHECIAIHQRTKSPYNYTTEKEHLPSTHRFVSEWTPERFLSWAKDIHTDVELFILKILNRKQHPEQGYKSCMGVLSFAKKVGNERLIKACQRALDYEIYNYKIIVKILASGLEQSNDEPAESTSMPAHENIRGEIYYQ